VINLSVHHQSAADAAAQSHVKHRIEPGARAVHRLAERPKIRVVIHKDGRLGQRRQANREREIRPAFNLVRAANPARLPIHRPAKADADGHRTDAFGQLGNDAFKLRANARAAAGSLDGEPMPFHDLRAPVRQ
jgi:hypothetical protein